MMKCRVNLLSKAAAMLFALLLCTLLFLPLSAVKAETSLPEDEEPTAAVQSVTRARVDPVILSDAEEDYTFKSSDGVLKAYNNQGYYINEEIFKLYARDSNGRKLISPNKGKNELADPPKSGSDCYGVTQVTFTKVYDLPENCTFQPDSRSLNDLCGELRVTNNSTSVGTGKILYRTCPTGYTEWGDWNIAELSDGNTIAFGTNLQVQIVVIYEVREAGYNIFQFPKYYHVRGVYRFNIYPA